MANEHVEEIGLKFKADGSADYLSTIKEIGNEQAALYAEYVRDVAMMDKDATATEKLTAKKQLLEKQVESQKNKVAVLRSELDNMTSSEDKNEAAISKKKKELAYAETQLEKYNKQLDSTVDGLKSHSEWTDKASASLHDIGGKVESAGKKMTVVSGAVTAIGVASIAAFNEVDEGLDTIILKTGATGETLESLEESFKNVYGSIPTSAADAGIAIGEVNTRFGETGENLESLSALFIKFASINEVDLNNAIGTSSKIMKQWNIDTSKAPNLLGLITSEAQRTGISVDKLMNLAQQNGATFKEMGLSIDESIVLLANFEASGVNTEVALTALRKSAVTYTKDGKTLSQGLAETITAIQGAKTETEALALAQEVFGAKGALEMSSAIREGRLSVDDLVSGMENMGTVVADTFEATLDAPDKLTVALNNAKIAGADLGASIFEVLAPVFDKLVILMQNLVAWFGSLDEGTKTTIVTVGLIVAALGPVLIILGKVISSVGSIIAFIPQLQSGFAAVGTAFKGFTSLIAAHPIVAGITALIAIILLLWNNCEWFRDLVKALWDWIKSTFSGLVDWLKTAFTNIGNALSSLWTSIKGIVDKIIDIFMTWINYIQSVFQAAWTAVFTAVTGVFQSFFNSFKAIFENVKGIFTGIIDFIKNVFSGNWKGAWESIVSVFGNVFGMLGNIVKAPVNAVISVINGALGGINKLAIDIPDWVPLVGGKRLGFNIPKIPMLATGGQLLSGMAIVAEAGPELIQQQGGRTVVTPLSGSSRNSAQMDLTDETIDKLARLLARILASIDTTIQIDEREFGRLVRQII